MKYFSYIQGICEYFVENKIGNSSFGCEKIRIYKNIFSFIQNLLYSQYDRFKYIINKEAIWRFLI